MIVLERKPSSKMLVLEALMRRLPESNVDFNYFRELYIRTKKGFEGELQVDKMWEELILSTESYYLFHNYQTKNDRGNSHQIDTIFLCRHFILLLEIKNITGRLDIEHEKHQLIRTNSDGTMQGFYNPIDQIERHVRFLKQKLLNWNISLPIEYGIVLTKASSIIGHIPKNVPFFHLSGLTSRINFLFNKYPENYISTTQMEILKNLLLEETYYNDWSPKVNKKKLRKGVICKECIDKAIMLYNRGRFICPNCNRKSKSALLEGLYDYRMLFKPWITNSEFKAFFKISSRETSYKLLNRLNLAYEGTNRGRLYYIPDTILDCKI